MMAVEIKVRNPQEKGSLCRGIIRVHLMTYPSLSRNSLVYLLKFIAYMPGILLGTRGK